MSKYLEHLAHLFTQHVLSEHIVWSDTILGVYSKIADKNDKPILREIMF